VSRTRCSVLTLLRRAGTQQAARFAATWAPALQRTVEETLRCVRGTRAEVRRNCFHIVIASAAKQSRIPPRRQSGLLRCARNDGPSGIGILPSRVPDATQRASGAAQSRDPAGHALADAWAPALQRTAEEALRCVRGTRPSFLN